MIKVGKTKNLVGLDIGSHSVKAVELKTKKGKALELVKLGYEILPHESIVEGTIMDSTAVAEAISRVFEENNIKNKNVAISLSGSGVIIKKIALPYLSPEELEESILWEAKHHIAFPLDEVTLDYVILESPESEAQRKMEVLLVAVKKDKINSYRSVVSQAGKNLEVIEVDAFALQNALELNYEGYRDKVIALINLGSNLTSTNIIAQGVPVFVREFAVSGNFITENIQNELNLTFEEAEQIKRGLKVKEFSSSEITPIIEANLKDLKEEIDKTFTFLDTQKIIGKKIDYIFLSGGTAKLKGLVEFFRNEFKTEVEILDPFRNVHYDENKIDPHYMETAPIFGISLGLALRKLGD
ncbi:MAG: type IV pilus assembly protein PilM [Candidatus Aminicenantia bacterium]